MRAWRNHLSRVPTWMPKSLAICTKVTSGSRSNATRMTSWRNSSGYLLGITTSFQASSKTSQIRCHLNVQQSQGREEDAFDLLTIAERLNAREERLAKSGWNTPPAVSKPLPTRPAKFPAVGHIVTGSHYDPDRSAEEIAELITRDLKAARASHAFPPSMGPF